jgi:hypothetical protein
MRASTRREPRRTNQQGKSFRINKIILVISLKFENTYVAMKESLSKTGFQKQY